MINDNTLPGYVPIRGSVIVLLAGKLYQGDPEIICVWKGAPSVVGVSKALKQLETKYDYAAYAVITSSQNVEGTTDVLLVLENEAKKFNHCISLSLEELKAIPDMKLNGLKKYLENK